MSLISSLRRATSALQQFRGATEAPASAVARLRTAVTGSERAVSALGKGIRATDAPLVRSKGNTDRFKSSLDKLKGSSDRTGSALRGVKVQADAVEKSVGRAGKNADRGGSSMGNLGKGLKGASLAQRGLNLAMAANPFGLVMVLLAPLIGQFVKMDKIVAIVQKTVINAWSRIKSASQTAAAFLKPVFKSVVDGFAMPVKMLVVGLNLLFRALNKVKFKMPGWVPKIGGKGFGFDLPQIPVPALAQGGIVPARTGGTLSLVGEGGEAEAVIPLSRLDGMLGNHPGGGLHRLARAVERLADRPVHVQVDSQTIARAVALGQRQLARR